MLLPRAVSPQAVSSELGKRNLYYTSYLSHFYTISTEVGGTFRIILKLSDWLLVSHMI